MSLDDILYLACLLGSIIFGYYYRKIRDVQEMKQIGTGFGLLIVFLVSGFHIFHSLISFLICSAIIRHGNKSQIHLISFGFMFLYLLFFRTLTYIGLSEVPGPVNMIQMILTLKLVGLAFEINTANNKIKQIKKTKSDMMDASAIAEMIITDYDKEIQNLSVADIFHYSFNYIGVLTGPYYRYRTFRDYFNTPFKNYANCFQATLEKIKHCAIFAIIYLSTNHIFPSSYATSDEFYDERSVFYRLFYIWPMFIVFRMRIYTGLVLSECVCTNSGFAAYAEDCHPVSGEGPRKDYQQYVKNPEKCKYSFLTIKNLDFYETETCWTFKEAMKTWNICVQYWLAINVYKRFPNKKYRQIATLLISSFWHGVHPGYYLCILGAAFVVPTEQMYSKLFRETATGIKLKIIDAIFWFVKFNTLGYLGMAFCLLTFEKIWHYYTSVYHIGYILWAISFALGNYLTKQRKKEEWYAPKIEQKMDVK